MDCVILTGTIASGKSTVADCFASHGIDVISADKIAKTLTEAHSANYNAIIAHFGDDIIDRKDCTLNRKKLRDIIFSNPEERLWLENLLHPQIQTKIKEAVMASESEYTLVEIPLLYDRKPYPFADRVLLILAPEDLQVQRLRERDHINTEQAKAMLAAQPDEKTRMELADDIIVNDMSLGSLELKTDRLHKKYLDLARQK